MRLHYRGGFDGPATPTNVRHEPVEWRALFPRVGILNLLCPGADLVQGLEKAFLDVHERPTEWAHRTGSFAPRRGSRGPKLKHVREVGGSAMAVTEKDVETALKGGFVSSRK